MTPVDRVHGVGGGTRRTWNGRTLSEQGRRHVSGAKRERATCACEVEGRANGSSRRGCLPGIKSIPCSILLGQYFDGGNKIYRAQFS